MGDSFAARLRRMAAEAESRESKFKSDIAKVRSDLQTARGRISDLQSAVDEEEDEKERLVKALKSAQAEAKSAKDEHATREKALMREVVALRFELAAARASAQDASRAERSAALAREGSLFELPSNLTTAGDADADLLHPDSFVNAAGRGLRGVLRTTLEPDASPERSAYVGQLLGRALLEAVAGGAKHLEVVRLLLEHGADINAKHSPEAGGRSVLHIAAAKGNKELVECILAVDGVEIDALDAQGRTPLHLAARLRKAEAAKALLHRGSDPDLRTPDGQTAADMARNSATGGTFSLSFSPLNIKQVFDTPSVKFWNSSALALRKYKDDCLTAALTYFTRAAEIAERHKSVTTPANLARLLYNRAKVAMKLGEICVSLESSDKALTLQPTYSNAREIRSECYWSLFDFNRALSDLQVLCKEEEDFGKRASLRARMSEIERCNKATHYQVLGTKRTAKSAEIKRAFRSASIRWHPDKHARSPEDLVRSQNLFQRINSAREVLMDENRRIIYDAETRYGSSYFSDSDDDDEWGTSMFSRNKSTTKSFPWTDDVLSEPLLAKKERLRKDQETKEREAEAAKEASASAAAAARKARASQNQEPDTSDSSATGTPAASEEGTEPEAAPTPASTLAPALAPSADAVPACAEDAPSKIFFGPPRPPKAEPSSASENKTNSGNWQPEVGADEDNRAAKPGDSNVKEKAAAGKAATTGNTKTKCAEEMSTSESGESESDDDDVEDEEEEEEEDDDDDDEDDDDDDVEYGQSSDSDVGMSKRQFYCSDCDDFHVGDQHCFASDSDEVECDWSADFENMKDPADIFAFRKKLSETFLHFAKRGDDESEGSFDIDVEKEGVNAEEPWEDQVFFNEAWIHASTVFGKHSSPEKNKSEESTTGAGLDTDQSPFAGAAKGGTDERDQDTKSSANPRSSSGNAASESVGGTTSAASPFSSGTSGSNHKNSSKKKNKRRGRRRH